MQYEYLHFWDKAGVRILEISAVWRILATKSGSTVGLTATPGRETVDLWNHSGLLRIKNLTAGSGDVIRNKMNKQDLTCRLVLLYSDAQSFLFFGSIPFLVVLVVAVVVPSQLKHRTNRIEQKKKKNIYIYILTNVC